MKTVFFGTPTYVLPILNAVNRYYPVVAVVTQPPKPVGRKQLKTYSAVDDWAHKRKIPIYFDPKDIVTNKVDADFGVCAAYGNLIPESVINYLKFGILNIHPSLLPKYRGASPVQTAILNGDTATGGTIMKLVKALDAGPIVTQFKEEILPADTNESLRDRLFLRSAEVLTECLPAYLTGKINLKPQNEKEVIMTKPLTRDDGFIDSDKAWPCQTERMLRAYTPWPGVWTIKDGKRMKILKGHVEGENFIPDLVQFEGKLPTPCKVTP